MTPILHIKNKFMAEKKKIVEKVVEVVEKLSKKFEVVNGIGSSQGTFTDKKEAEDFAALHGFILK